MVFSIPTPNGSSSERLRFFPRQLLTPDDLTQEQDYFRGRMRRHNRFLHGWGVVCGCQVRATTTDWTVTIDPGYVLGPQGDEILIDSLISVDLSRQDLAGNAAMPCADPLDPWCSRVRVVPQLRRPLYLAVAYAESSTRPVRVQTAGCGCDGSQCEYSRTRDGYVVRLLTALPASYSPMPQRIPGTDCPGGGVRPCPPVLSDPWVILATVAPQSQTIAETDIDNFTLRRYVATFADWWYACAAVAPTPTPSPTPSPGPTPSPSPTPQPAGLTVQSVAFDPSVVQPGDISTGRVTISGPATAAGTAVGLSSDNPSVATVPNSVTVPSGSTSITFQATTQAVGVARVTATLSTSQAVGQLIVRRSKSPVEKTHVDKVQLEKVTDKVQLEKVGEVAKATDVIRAAQPGQVIQPGTTFALAASALPADSNSRRAFIQPAERPPVGTAFLSASDGTSST